MCQGLRILVTATAASHVEWLREFVAPQFEFSAADTEHDVAVHFVEDDERHARLSARGAATPRQSVNCFMLDSKTLRYEMWNSADAGVTVFDHDANLFYEIENGGRAVTVLARAGNVRARVPWMRVVRELAMSHVYDAGQLLLHASTCVLNGKGLIITAPSGGGKTTLLMHLLHRAGTKYLTNDRLAISFGTAGVRLRGMPTIVTVRPGTVRMMPEFGERLRNASCNHRLTLRESAAQKCGPPRPWDDGRIGLSPAQFCGLLAVPSAAEARGFALILPRITGETGGCVVRQLPPTQATEILTHTLFAARWLSEPSQVFTAPGVRRGPDPANLAEQCNRLAQTIPCLECGLGYSAYDPTHCAADVLTAALEKF